LNFEGYEWLYTAQIFHRDISLNNVMFRKKDGKIFGVLNDFDLAILRTSEGPSSKTRTGTKPFIAVDLLGEPDDVHRYRHDLESLFYVIVYVTSRYHEGREIENPPLQEWNDLDEHALESVKNKFLNGLLPKRTPNFEGFASWIVDIRDALQDGFTARRRYRDRGLGRLAPYGDTFDQETLGGKFSFDAFRKILLTEI
jgi:serine/threonine protein kinase